MTARLFIDGIDCGDVEYLGSTLSLPTRRPRRRRPRIDDGAFHLASIRYAGSVSASAETLRRRAGYGGRKGRRAQRRLRCER